MADSRTALLLIDFINPLDFPGARAIYCNDNFGHWEAEFSALVSRCRTLGGMPAALVETVAPERGDYSILKPRHSAFFGTPLAFLLEQMNVDRLILTGLAADNCIMFTAHDAYLREFGLRIPVDCVASESRTALREAMSHMTRVLKADVRPSRYR